MASIVAKIVTREVQQFDLGKGETSIGEMVEQMISDAIRDAKDVMSVTVEFSENETEEMRRRYMQEQIVEDSFAISDVPFTRTDKGKRKL